MTLFLRALLLEHIQPTCRASPECWKVRDFGSSSEPMVDGELVNKASTFLIPGRDNCEVGCPVSQSSWQDCAPVAYTSNWPANTPIFVFLSFLVSLPLSPTSVSWDHLSKKFLCLNVLSGSASGRSQTKISLSSATVVRSFLEDCVHPPAGLRPTISFLSFLNHPLLPGHPSS